MESVILYSTHCSRCCVLEEKLEDADIAYNIVTDESIMSEKGLMSAPALELTDGKILTFVEAVKWIEENGT